jgi:hypothetical protein
MSRVAGLEAEQFDEETDNRFARSQGGGKL